MFYHGPVILRRYQSQSREGIFLPCVLPSAPLHNTPPAPTAARRPSPVTGASPPPPPAAAGVCTHTAATARRRSRLHSHDLNALPRARATPFPISLGEPW